MQRNAPLWFKEEFVKRYGAVSRSRGCYLYTQKGVRLTDMYQDGGRAVLGRSGSKALKVFKNTLDRGQTGFFPCMYEKRFEKAALSLVSGYAHARWFSSEESLLTAVYRSGWGSCSGNAADSNRFGVKLWRPWLADFLDQGLQNFMRALFFADCSDCSEAFFIPGVVALYVPFALCESGYVALFEEKEGTVLPCSDPCSPALLNAVARALNDLLYELPKRTEKNWALFDSVLGKYFMRLGAYLVPKIKSEQYKDFVLHCLDCALVLPPLSTLPAIVPFGASEGDFSKLNRHPF